MKNIIVFAVCIFILGTTAVMGQTYYYKGVYSVKKQTGMKSESGGGVYITFTDEGCYFSDENGNNKRGFFFKYYGKSDKTVVYRAWSFDAVNQQLFGDGNRWESIKMIFSLDHTRMNYDNELLSWIDVYERANPEDVDVPDQLY